jgi:hypothetical protein
MSGTFMACSPECKTPEWCFGDGGCGISSVQLKQFVPSDRHDGEPDTYMCLITGICDMQDRCKASNDQCAVQEISSVVRQLVDVLGRTNVWILSGDDHGVAFVDAWLDGSVWPLSHERRNLRFALDCLDDAMGYKDMPVIYAWFVGRNIGSYSLITAVPAGEYAIAVQSLEELIER